MKIGKEGLNGTKQKWRENNMFYVKENLNDALDVSIEINDENVFTHCPVCLKEISVDLTEVLKDGDLFGISVLCKKCGKKLKNGEFGEIEKFHDFLSKLHGENEDE